MTLMNIPISGNQFATKDMAVCHNTSPFLHKICGKIKDAEFWNIFQWRWPQPTRDATSVNKITNPVDIINQIRNIKCKHPIWSSPLKHLVKYIAPNINIHKIHIIEFRLINKNRVALLGVLVRSILVWGTHWKIPSADTLASMSELHWSENGNKICRVKISLIIGAWKNGEHFTNDDFK